MAAVERRECHLLGSWAGHVRLETGVAAHAARAATARVHAVGEGCGSHTEWELSPGWHVPELAGQVFDAYLCVTECVLHLGDPEDRLAAFAEDLHRQAVRAGARRGEAFAATVIGEAHLLAGRPDLACTHLREAVAVSRRVGAVSGESLARARLGEALHALGDEVGARASLAEALELAHASALAHHLLFLVHVPMLRLERDPAAALALVESSQILLEDQGVCVFCPVAYAIAAASACVRGGELDRADALLARARASASMWPPGAWSPAICEVTGELARARGCEVDDTEIDAPPSLPRSASSSPHELRRRVRTP